LRSEGEILEKVFPLVIREKYLSDRGYVLTEQLYHASLKTPGETRIVSRSAIEQGITEGVRTGLFGLGELEDNKPICRYFKEHPTVALTGNEALISEALCVEQKKKEEIPTTEQQYTLTETGIKPKDKEGKELAPDFSVKSMNKVQLRFSVPKGKIASIMGVMNLLQNKFETLEIELTAKEGTISEQDYEDKVKETFRQLGIKLEE
jgi:hypothetical protein